MATIDPHAREVVFKVVLHGPGLGGKTTSLRHVHGATGPLRRGSLLELATAGERTVAFDFLPLRVPRVAGRDVRLELFTVPGQAYYPTTRRLVLSGVDAVVFVGDAQAGRRDRNEESLAELRRHLVEQGRRLDAVPHVFQWNKQDLEDAEPVDVLRDHFDPEGHAVAHVGSVATRGQGVFEALDAAVVRVAADLDPELALPPLRDGTGRASLVPAPQTPGASFVPLFAAPDRALAARVETLLLEGRAELALPLVDELLVRGLSRAAAGFGPETARAADDPRDVAAQLGIAAEDYALVRRAVRACRTGHRVSGREALGAYAVAVQAARAVLARS